MSGNNGFFGAIKFITILFTRKEDDVHSHNKHMAYIFATYAARCIFLYLTTLYDLFSYLTTLHDVYFYIHPNIALMCFFVHTHMAQCIFSYLPTSYNVYFHRYPHCTKYILMLTNITRLYVFALTHNA